MLDDMTCGAGYVCAVGGVVAADDGGVSSGRVEVDIVLNAQNVCLDVLGKEQCAEVK